MKLRATPQHSFHHDDSLQIKAVEEATSPAFVGICVGSVFLVVTLAAVSCVCYRRRSAVKLQGSQRRGQGVDKNLPLKKSPAVRSPSSGPAGPILKKSPSPTGTKSPLGQKSPSSQEKPTQLGQLHFRLRYNSEKHALLVTIVRCADLPARDPNTGSSDPYVKLQLLPEKQHKVKTRVLRRTLSPVYDEDFTFYGINPNQLQATTLHFVVLSFDRYSRDDVIGEVVCSMAGLDTEHLDKTLALSREIAPRHFKIRSQGRGELLVSLCHQPAANRLTVVVLKARNLPKVDITGLSDPYVKIYLLYNQQRIAKKKTHIKKRTVNPVFNESFVFEVPYNEGLDNLSLEFLVLDWDRVTKNEVVGRLELGPRGSPAAQQHWLEVCNSPRRQIAEWHKLRE
ncbi:synaptotagmin, putative [Ixodes scapularis]|uniref:Synaptotagmin, putative n=1 Tax=Ixodes scapularis TaxID=6945 RepID=B7PXT8_IXOSC|nr:synaptotagmin, putative [Ixodes scapularis]|eukprot:XP_002436307.1 synaptotagmin, putative [Ixodes scapularis]